VKRENQTVALAVFLGSTLAHAEKAVPFEVGYDLKVFCTAPKDHVLFGLCLGLVSGYFESFRSQCKGDSNSITRPQLAEVVLKFYRDHPDRLHGAALVSASEALKEAFDCSPR